MPEQIHLGRMFYNTSVPIAKTYMDYIWAIISNLEHNWYRDT